CAREDVEQTNGLDSW
nr:immunoglobulin heavy chain junction region [Macaca mulatta]MOY21352.1 immunoglobulin heavy chain junction region [Macaca mulatta]MOY21544.1 immunoglobulin heavy chain junction region [Macaca mulatta]MOY24042.1 immunoglobulin heavy chain junction region [Macaca mulatta]MOY24305.1 immunoglobulin heavy chain junction region [Macaca mulatta]